MSAACKVPDGLDLHFAKKMAAHSVSSKFAQLMHLLDSGFVWVVSHLCTLLISGARIKTMQNLGFLYM